MATLEKINYQPMIFNPTDNENTYGFVVNRNRRTTNFFPQIFLSDGEPWHEANSYAFYRYLDLNKDIKTIDREMNHLSRYADWLEKEGLHWLHFPKLKRERCLFRFRGYLIESRDNQILAPSTVSQLLNAVIAFYKWASAKGLAVPRAELFDDKNITIKFFDKVGFSRTMNVASTELAIPNRKRNCLTLEGGLTPLTKTQAAILMEHLHDHKNYQLYLMHKTCLLTGCRHETITSLTIDALKYAYQDPSVSNAFRVKVGAGTSVKTKYDVVGDIYFPKTLIKELIEYYESATAIFRRSKSSSKHLKLIFLTSQGNPYTRQTFGTLIKRLKNELIEKGYSEFARFKFHQLRATFGTMLMRSALKIQGISPSNAIEFVKDAMLHKYSATTWKYIKFIEREPIEDAFLEHLWSIFTGESHENNSAY